MLERLIDLELNSRKIAKELDNLELETKKMLEQSKKMLEQLNSEFKEIVSKGDRK